MTTTGAKDKKAQFANGELVVLRARARSSGPGQQGTDIGGLNESTLYGGTYI
jgi:hypothetical protein